MLNDIISQKKAVILVCIGYGYSASISLPHVLIAPEDYKTDPENYSCFKPLNLFHKITNTIWAGSVICLVNVVVMLQMATYFKLWKRQQMAIGSNMSNNGRTRMYKRAMVTTSLIATAFLVGWLPVLVCILIADWSSIDQEKTLQVTSIFATLGVIQSCSNAIIFKLRNMDLKQCTQIRIIKCLNL